MNAKISFPDLIDLFAQKLSITKKESEAFLKEFFVLSSDVISMGEQLKISGLGIFKPIWVEARTSVNVQTGQPFEIPGHYKLSFVPDKVLREAVNAPFSCFSVEVIEDDVNLADVNVDRDNEEDLGNERGMDETGLVSGSVIEIEENSVKEIVVTEQEETVPAEKVDSVVSSVVTSPQQEENDMEKSEKLSAEIEKKSKNIEETSRAGIVFPPDVVPDDVETVAECEREEKKKAHRRGYLVGFLSACSLLFLGIAIWLFVSLYCMDREIKLEIAPITFTITNIEKNNEPPLVVNTMTTDSIKAVARLNQTAKVETGNAPMSENDTLTRPDISESDVEKKNMEPEILSDKVIEETIRPGIFLTTLALKHYGHKAFWVYIYEENKSHIKNPDVIAIGTKLIIPDASKYGIDAKNKESIDKAKELAMKLVDKNR